MKTILRIEGIHCKSCKVLIEDVCNDFPEIQSCNVNYETGETTVEHDAYLDLQNLKNGIESLGEYKVLFIN
ncbi:hypothetical protein A2335_01975 [Candidatus Peregrinibacteria bacterium RIFOXYB2_FULL_32_7]|nr:MAG: hypothetical protein A2335_01975 [Candidatus Peregrinibacteria bacterium RIFOXYB2_FULL_32_7]